MSEQFPADPRLEQPGATDESLLSAHEKELATKPDDGGHYRMAPLVLLFVFSGLIFYAGTYLNHYAGEYKSTVFDETASPASATAAVAQVDPMVLGKRQYDLVCMACHQATGLGIEGVYPPLAGSDWVTGSPDRVIRILLHGLKGPITVNGKQYGVAAMPAFGKVTGGGYNWNDDRVAAVLTYIRQSWGNSAEPITPDQVAAVVAQVGDRKEWTAEELEQIP
jgi:mono/diheme cytochrome c family protein